MTTAAPSSSRTSARTRWPASSEGGDHVAADESAGAGDEDRGHRGWLRGSVAVSDAITHCSHPTGSRMAHRAADSRQVGRRPYHRPMTQLDARTLRSLTHAMPKAELHLHLDGSLRVDTALDIARTRRVDAPVTLRGHVAPRSSARSRCTDQAELLLAFDLPIALMQDAEALERIAADLVEDKAADRVRYMEIRWGAAAPHAEGPDAGDRSSTRSGAAPTARPGGHGVDVRLIATLMRSHAPDANLDFVLGHGPGGHPGRPGRGGPRRAGGALPGSGTPSRSDRHGPGPGAARHARMPASGAGPGRSGGRWRWSRSGSRTARWPSTIRSWSGSSSRRRSGWTSASPPTTRRGSSRPSPSTPSAGCSRRASGSPSTPTT